MSTSTNTPARKGGPGWLATLEILFVTLKLTDNIDWSWGVVLIPLYVFAALVVVSFIVAVATAKSVKKKVTEAATTGTPLDLTSLYDNPRRPNGGYL